MKYLRKFKESFNDMLPNIEGILCQFKDNGIDYKVENYKDDSIIAILLELKNYKTKSVNDVIMAQLEDYLVDYTLVDKNTNRYGGTFIEYIFMRKDISTSIFKEYEIFKINNIYNSLRSITESIESRQDLLEFSKSNLSYIIDKGFIIKSHKTGKTETIFITGEENTYITYSGRNKQFKYNDIKDDFIPYIYSLSKEFSIDVLFETPASISSGTNVSVLIDDILSDRLLNYSLYTIIINAN